MRGVPGYPTIDIPKDRIAPSDQRVDRNATDTSVGDNAATIRSTRALIMAFERGDLSADLLVRDLRVKAFRFHVINPLRRALCRAKSLVRR